MRTSVVEGRRPSGHRDARFSNHACAARLAVLVSVGLLGLVVPASAWASPAGPEGPGSCTFDHGTTTCGHEGVPEVTSSTTTPDLRTGCTTTTATTTTTTTYTAHRGTYNSRGRSVEAPAATTTSTTSSTEHCPVHGSVPLRDVGLNLQDCDPDGQYSNPTGVQVGTVYYYEGGADVRLHVEVTNVTPAAFYGFAARCIGFLVFDTSEADGSTTFDTTYFGGAGQTLQFDIETFADRRYAVTPYVTV